MANTKITTPVDETVNFENVDVEKLEELEEVVTPGAGSIGCCTG